MRTLISICILLSLVLLGFTFGKWYCSLEYAELQRANEFKFELIKAYEQYYDGTEELLDSLNSEYNWVDSYDNYNYYEGAEKLDSLYNTQL